MKVLKKLRTRIKSTKIEYTTDFKRIGSRVIVEPEHKPLFKTLVS